MFQAPLRKVHGFDPVGVSAGTAMLLLTLYAFAPNSDAAEVAQGKVVGGKISEHPSWFKESFLDIAEDVDEAAGTDRHVMLYLYLDDCPYCYKMVEENFEHASYTDYLRENFDVIALNIRGDREVAFDAQTSLTEKELAHRLKVRYTPTVIFLDHENKIVARVNGYRSAEDFKLVLDYVKSRSYERVSLSQYIDQRKTKRYAFRPHPQLISTNNLQQFADRPLAVLFEDQGCTACDALHDGHLSDPEVRKVLKNFAFVRLDALSTEPLIDPTGKATTPRAYAAQLGLTYRPGIVLFEQGREIARIESMLYRYHFTELLRYVGERHYRQYPDSFYDYLSVRTKALTAAGKNVNIGE